MVANNIEKGITNWEKDIPKAKHNMVGVDTRFKTKPTREVATRTTPGVFGKWVRKIIEKSKKNQF